jgi:hypothetical protein
MNVGDLVTIDQQKATADSSGFAPPPPKPVYFGDIDEVLRKVAENVPFVDTERIYLWELETQGKVYMAIIVLSLIMVVFAVLLSIIPMGGV